MTSSALARIPAPVRRIVAFTLSAVVVYAILFAVGTLFLGPSAAPGSFYSISATMAAGVAALYLVYLGGFGRIRDLFR
ncbi:MAG TPA: hypothetical protein VKA37_13270 [Halobacteriales archaeon]|nr:hypothetical protein [Halobacteriales archaeon]